MGNCTNHPDVETPFQCQRHGVFLCQARLRCRDPQIYCKFRSSCAIAFVEKSDEGWDAKN